MQTIRRIYIYTITLVSLETILWGLIGLLRSIASPQIVGGAEERLAAPLAFVIVGIPVFYIHWRWAQHAASLQREEAQSWVRILFFYLVMAFLLIPIVQNGLAFLSRSLMIVFGLDAWHALVGGQQTSMDNAIAVSVNTFAVAYFYPLLKQIWGRENLQVNKLSNSKTLPSYFFEFRRLYRYLWLFYGLGITALGIHQLIQYILLSPNGIGVSSTISLANGLALVGIGFPLWAYVHQLINQSLDSEEEARSWLRFVFLLGLVLFSLFAILYNAGNIGRIILRWIMGENLNSLGWLGLMNRPISLLLPFLGIWWIYKPQLHDRIAKEIEIASRASLTRFYRYLLTLGGLVTLLLGLSQILAFVIESRLNPQASWENDLRNMLAAAIMLILIGFPLWWDNWRKINQEINQRDMLGEKALRSLVRRSYLYLLILSGVLGVMFSSGAILYRVLMGVFGTNNPNLFLESMRNFRLLILFGFLWIYHWKFLQTDLHKIATILETQRGNYAVAILMKDIQKAKLTCEEIEQEAPGVTVKVISPENDTAENLQDYQCLVVDDETLGENLTMKMITSFQGVRLIVTGQQEGWYWSCGLSKRPLAQIREVSKWIRDLADGQTIRQSSQSNIWNVVAYVLAGLFVLQILFGLIMTAVSFIAD